MHVGQADGYVLRVASLAVERHQERVRIVWIDTHVADGAATGGCAIGPGHVVVKRKHPIYLANMLCVPPA